jgi:amino acid adenylation domain-containing protein
MLALRTGVSSELSFTDVLRRVRATTLAAYAHQDVPFEKLVEELQPERDMSRTPLFQAVFTLQPAMEGGREMRGLQVSAEEAGSEWAQFDLTLLTEETADGSVAAAFEYSTALFDEETVRRMSTVFMQLLERVAEGASRRVSELSPLSEEERRLALVEWNQTRADYPRGRCFQQLFEDCAARHPDRVALVAGDEELSYGELNRRANRLAHHLRAHGVGPERRVAIMLERSAEMLVSLLGVLKAGGAYVPLDPEYPQERLAFMLADSGVELLLTRERFAGLAPSDSTRVVCLDRDGEEIASRGDENPSGGAEPDNLAYVIYTSGSTGRPKGVQVSHRALVNFLTSMALAPGLGEDDVLLAVTSLSFDIAALELYLPLARGARVVLASSEEASDARALLRLSRANGATVMQATPTTWRMLIEAGWEGGDGLKVLCGGEALPARLAAELSRRSTQVWNMYGPTETTIWSTLGRVEPGVPSVNIGRPVANTQVYILDDSFEPVAPGVRGELYIGGDGLARGYLRRPAATAERFIPDPFSAEPGARLYRTGDLARHMPGGIVEYLGRRDQQIKLHGHRIEPGEIEAALAAHPSVSEALVLLKEATPGETRLVAYLVGRGNETATDAGLREFLKGRLPAYMLPAAYVWVERWPLTPNGKLDRKALPAPPRPGTDPARERVAPRDVIEEMLATIWAELLGVEHPGVEDSFFELGGHSLLATQLLSRLRQTFQVEMPLRLLFQSPTIATLSRLLVEHEARPGQTEKIARAMKKIKGMSAGDVREVLRGKRQAVEG